MIKIDPVTADQIRQILVASRARGVDPVQILDRADMLDYPAKRSAWSAILLDQVAKELRNGSLGMMVNKELASGRYKTPADVRDMFIDLLERIARSGERQSHDRVTNRNDQQRDPSAGN